MGDGLRKGDRVEWSTSQGTTRGRVVKRLTAPIDIGGHHVAASKDAPQFLVRSDRTGAEAAHHAEALKKTGGRA